MLSKCHNDNNYDDEVRSDSNIVIVKMQGTASIAIVHPLTKHSNVRTTTKKIKKIPNSSTSPSSSFSSRKKTNKQTIKKKTEES